MSTSDKDRRKSVSKASHFVLGIDVGTTSVKVCLVDIDSKEVSHKFVKDTLAAMPKDVPQADLQVSTSTVWKMQNFTLIDFSQNFREINFFTI